MGTEPSTYLMDVLTTAPIEQDAMFSNNSLFLFKVILERETWQAGFELTLLAKKTTRPQSQKKTNIEKYFCWWNISAAECTEKIYDPAMNMHAINVQYV